MKKTEYGKGEKRRQPSLCTLMQSSKIHLIKEEERKEKRKKIIQYLVFFVKEKLKLKKNYFSHNSFDYGYRNTI